MKTPLEICLAKIAMYVAGYKVVVSETASPELVEHSKQWNYGVDTAATQILDMDVNEELVEALDEYASTINKVQ